MPPGTLTEWHLYAKIGDQTTKLQFPSWSMVIDRVLPLVRGHALENTIRHEVNQATPGKEWSLWTEDCTIKLQPIRKHQPMDLTAFIEAHETDSDHSILGASSSSQWMACPGRNNMIREIQESQPEALHEVGQDAKLGTVAHTLGEMALRDGQDTIVYIDRPIYIYDKETGEISETFHVDEIMATNVQVWVDECRKHEDADVCQVEARLSLQTLNPPAPMFGTTDFYALYLKQRLLVVQDYKNGRVPVDPQSSQLKFYAVQVLVNLPETVQRPERVLVKIVQPRGIGTVVKEHEYTAAELLHWAEHDLLPAARRTLEPDAPLVAGEHCFFCPARAVCGPRNEYILEQAGITADVSELPAVLEQRVIPAIESIPLSDLSNALLAAQPLVQWAKAAEKALISAIGKGYEDPNFNIKSGQGHRKFVNTEKVVETISKLGVDPEKLYRKQMLSPKSVEDVVISHLCKLKMPLQSIRPMIRSVVDDLTTRPDSAPKLVAKGLARLSQNTVEFEADVLEDAD